MSSPLETQYKCLNERRLHFGKLFFQNIGGHIFGVTGTMIALQWIDTSPFVGAAVTLLAGLGTLLMSFIAYRLQRLEVIYEGHLRAIEDQWIASGIAGIQRPPVTEKLSSRTIVVAVLALGGLGLTLLGVTALGSQM